ncbi:hypothetical protein ISS22_16865, partial [candidate division KSB1 bacterium]|nr:hypothetical protein [candidate division KSB1 bacterium]
MLINSNKKFSTTVFLLFSLIIITQFLLPINSFSQSHTILWQEDWEGDWINNWYVDGGTWEVGAPTSGPDSAYIGQKCAATVLDGNYSESVNSRLIRRTSFKVPSASENPRLRFWHWYSFSSFDYGEIQIKTGSIWKTISTQYTSTGSDVWTYPLID